MNNYWSKRRFLKINLNVSVILMLVSQRAEVEIVRLFGSDETIRNMDIELTKQRGAAPSLLECIVVLYVIGFIWQEMREVFFTHYNIIFVIYTICSKNQLKRLLFIDF